MVKTYQVKLDAFEGPLDLLLHLINQYEIDIYDIPVAQITEQYMEYVHTMQRLELDIASEYLVMAATLLALKSQMLLPKQEIETEDETYMEDPREELMQRLIEYRKFKEAAAKLQEKEINHTYTRPAIAAKSKMQKPVKKGDMNIYDMLHALDKMFERKKWNQPLETKVTRSEIPIAQRMTEIIEVVKDSADGVSFDQLFIYPSRSHVVVTFIAILELMKSNQVQCMQERHLEELYVLYLGE